MTARSKLTAKQVTAAILAGDLAGHEVDVIKAITTRVEQGAVRLGWRIDIFSLDITQENLTIGEAKLVEELVASSELYEDAGPPSVWRLVPAGSALNIAAFVTACLIKRQGLDRTAATEKIDSASASELLRSVRDYELSDFPKDDGDPTPP